MECSLPRQAALQRRGVLARRSQLIKKVHFSLSELPSGGRSHPTAGEGAKGLEGESRVYKMETVMVM